MATLLCLMLPVPGLATGWPIFRRDVARTGYAREHVAPPLTPRWSFDTGGAVVSSPVVQYGRVFIGSRSGKLFALDAYTGALIWSFDTGDWVDATPAVSGGKVFVSGRNGGLYCFDALANTATQCWPAYQTGSTDFGSPLVYNGEVFMATGYPNKKLLVIDSASGALKRSADLSQFSASSPVLDVLRGRVYLGTNDGRYNAFEAFTSPMTGVWPSPVQTRGGIGLATPALSGDRLVAVPGDDDWKARSYSPASGGQQWASADLSANASQATSVAVSSDTAYAGSGSATHSLQSLNLASGGVNWSVPLGAASKLGIGSSPAVANDMIYVLSPAGELYGVHKTTGGVQAKIALGDGDANSSPAVANGWVYAATAGGKVWGFAGTRVAAISSPDQFEDSPEGIVSVTGSALSPVFDKYVVEVGSGTDPSAWTQIAEGSGTVTRGTLASWDTTQLEGDYTLRLRVVETAPSGFDTQARSVFSVLQNKVAGVSASSDTTLSLSDGTEIFIPEGALETDDVLTLRKVVSGFPAAQSVHPQAAAAMIVRELKLGSSPRPKFLKPVTFKIPYHTITPRKVENLRMYYYEEGLRKWIVINTTVVNEAEKRVWAEIDHFTLFGVWEFSPLGSLLHAADVYSYPNPARGNTVNFKFKLGDTVDVKIRIYDITGDLVAELALDNALGGTVRTLTWDIANRASGIYVYHLEAKRADGKVESVRKKLAVIH